MAQAKIRTKDNTRIFLRPIASGLPLGFFSLGIGMLVTGALSLGWIPISETPQVGMIFVAFIFPLELLAAVFAFLARDTMGATTIGLFASSWLITGVSDITARPGTTSKAMGIFIFGFSGAIALIAGLAVLAKPFFTVLLSVAFVRSILSGIYEMGGGHSLFKISGYFALALTLLAYYGAVGFALEDGHQKEILPLFRRGAADEAFAGYEKQLERLEAEAGVRQQL